MLKDLARFQLNTPMSGKLLHSLQDGISSNGSIERSNAHFTVIADSIDALCLLSLRLGHQVDQKATAFLLNRDDTFIFLHYLNDQVVATFLDLPASLTQHESITEALARFISKNLAFELVRISIS